MKTGQRLYSLRWRGKKADLRARAAHEAKTPHAGDFAHARRIFPPSLEPRRLLGPRVALAGPLISEIEELVHVCRVEILPSRYLEICRDDG